MVHNDFSVKFKLSRIEYFLISKHYDEYTWIKKWMRKAKTLQKLLYESTIAKLTYANPRVGARIAR